MGARLLAQHLRNSQNDAVSARAMRSRLSDGVAFRVETTRIVAVITAKL